MSIRTRIKIGNQVFDFDRPPSFVRKTETRAIVENEAASGKTEVIHYYDRAGVTLERGLASPQYEGMMREIWFLMRQGAACELWIDLDAPIVMNLQGGVPKTNNSGLFTFSRGSKSTVIAPNGLLVELISDQPGITRGPFTNGIEIWRQNINLLNFSNVLNNAAWVATNANIEINTNDTADPKGGFTANRVNFTGIGSLVQTTSTGVGTTSWTFSAFVKANVPGQILNMYVVSSSAGNLLLQQALLTSDWQRAFASFISPGSTLGNVGVRFEMSSGQSFFCYGCQLEPQLTQRGPGAYVETTSIFFTRQFDHLRINIPSLNFPSDLRKGTISFWYKRTENELFSGTDQYLVYLKNLTLTSDKWIAVSFVGNDIKLVVQSPNDTEFAVLFAIESLIPDNTWKHYAVTWDADIANGLKIYFDGVLRATSSNVAFATKPIANATDLVIGNSGISDGAEGAYSDFMIFPRVLSASEIFILSTQITSSFHERNHYPALILNQDSYAPQLLEGNAFFDVSLSLKEKI